AGTPRHPLLALGYAVATSTLNVSGNNCNAQVSAETLSMVKEHFIKQFGMPVHTIGEGGSSGAVQQYLIAEHYPGLLDGFIAHASAPDELTEIGPFTDCWLLDHALQRAHQRWTEAQKTAVSGYATWQACATAVSALKDLGWIDPKKCDAS